MAAVAVASCFSGATHSLVGEASIRASAPTMSASGSPSNTRIASTFGISDRMRENVSANSASTYTTDASQWSTTYAASSSDRR